MPDHLRAIAQSEAKSLQSLEITTVELEWVQVLAEGWAYPLKGFMREDEFLQTIHFNCIQSTEQRQRFNQSVPIVLSVSEEERNRLDGVSSLVLHYNHQPVAILRKPEFYRQPKEERCARQFGTTNQAHPYIKVDIIWSGVL